MSTTRGLHINPLPVTIQAVMINNKFMPIAVYNQIPRYEVGLWPNNSCWRWTRFVPLWRVNQCQRRCQRDCECSHVICSDHGEPMVVVYSARIFNNWVNRLGSDLLRGLTLPQYGQVPQAYIGVGR